MKLLLQRVDKASVEVNNKIVGAIEKGLLVFVGFKKTDTKHEVDTLIDRLIKLRIMPDQEGQTKFTLHESNDSLLLVSQFTLYADCSNGTRPSFSDAMAGAQAKDLYDYMVIKLQTLFQSKLQTGVFAAYMKVSLVNDGPYTILLEKEAV
jgi:D-tyrosyl-tRNA(Tyr) deacylase